MALSLLASPQHLDTVLIESVVEKKRNDFNSLCLCICMYKSIYNYIVQVNNYDIQGWRKVWHAELASTVLSHQWHSFSGFCVHYIYRFKFAAYSGEIMFHVHWGPQQLFNHGDVKCQVHRLGICFVYDQLQALSESYQRCAGTIFELYRYPSVAEQSISLTEISNWPVEMDSLCPCCG